MCFLCPDAIVRGLVWLDVDANGVRAAGEAVYSGGVTVELRQGSTVIATTTTNSLGQYVFSSVPPGAYSVRFVSPAGFVFSPSNQGTDDSKDSDADPSTGSSGTFTLTSGQDLAGPDAGIHTSVARCVLPFNVFFCQGVDGYLGLGQGRLIEKGLGWPFVGKGLPPPPPPPLCLP